MWPYFDSKLCIAFESWYTIPSLSANSCRTYGLFIKINAVNQYLNRNLLKLGHHLFSDSRWPLPIGWFPVIMTLGASQLIMILESCNCFFLFCLFSRFVFWCPYLGLGPGLCYIIIIFNAYYARLMSSIINWQIIFRNFILSKVT